MPMPRSHVHKRVFDFVIFSNLFIACCAVMMAWFTVQVFNDTPSVIFLWFIFFSTLASYSIHWYLTDEASEITAQRTSWLSSNKSVHFIFFIISAAGSALFLLLEISNFKWLLPAVFLTLLYSAPKIPLPLFAKLKTHIWGKTILLAAMWTYVTAALPLLIRETNWQAEHWVFCFNRFTLIFAICILFDLRDKEYDKATGVKSLITLLSRKRVRKIFNIIILCGILSSFFFYFKFQDESIVIILAIPALLTYLLYRSANKTLNDYLFYFILDGLMALSAVLYLAGQLAT